MRNKPERMSAYRQAQESFIDTFDRRVGQICLMDIAVPVRSEDINPEIGRYGLIPIFGDNLISTLITPGYGCKVPDGISLDCEEPDGRPYLDAGLAVGLTYDNSLTAIASAALTARPEINIVQIQSVTLRSQHPDTRQQTGLFSTIR